MEMKAVCEYNEPEYVTRDYGRNKVLRFVMNCKKVSVGVLVMLFLWSNEVKAVPFVQIDGGLSYMDEKTVMKNSVISVLKVYGCWLGVCVIVIAIYGILQSIKIKKIEDENEKNTQKKKRNWAVIWGIVVSLIAPLILASLLYILFKN